MSEQAIWDSLTTYAINDVVEQGGQVFRALMVNVGTAPVISPPASSADWDFIGQVGGGGLVSVSASSPLTASTVGGAATVGTLPSVNLPSGSPVLLDFNTVPSVVWATTPALTNNQWQLVVQKVLVTAPSPPSPGQSPGNFSVIFTAASPQPPIVTWEPIDWFTTPGPLPPNNLSFGGSFVVRGQGNPLSLGANGFNNIVCNLEPTISATGSTAVLCIPIPNPP